MANWLGALALAVDAEVARAAGDRGGSYMGALLTCSYFAEVTAGELGEVLGLTGSGAVRLVDRLERVLGKVLHDAGLDPGEARMVCRLCDHRRCDGEACPVGRSLRERGAPAPRAAAAVN